MLLLLLFFFFRLVHTPKGGWLKQTPAFPALGPHVFDFFFFLFIPLATNIYIYIFFLSCKPFCSLHESLNSKPNSSFSDHPDTSTQHRHTRPYLKPTSKLIGYSQGCLLLKYLSLCTSVVFYKLIFFIFFFHRDIHPVLQENDGLNMA